jgi:glycosyltransferase involved in cell wall biosynthesis
MKLISFAIPCYNSQDYMRKCIESILPGGEDVEILIIDDGSSDDTAKIADEYQAKYPTICRAIHQENGGHGEAVNTGIRNARGLYFKVVDSDDWVDEDAYRKVREKLHELVDKGTPVDMLVTNYVYEKLCENHQRRMIYEHMFPENEIIGWDGLKRVIKGNVILMHSVTYRTEVLRKSGLVLPKHTFYVDNLFVFEPLPYVKTMYYLNVDYYRYLIGREGQSVAEQTMIRRIDQQLAVNYRMVDYFCAHDSEIQNPMLRKYMLSYLEMITVVSSSLGYVSKDPVIFHQIHELWKYIKEKNPGVYRRLRYGIFGFSMNIPGKFGRGVARKSYHLAQRFMGFN